MLLAPIWIVGVRRNRIGSLNTEKYLNGRNPEFVQEKLHVSRGTYFEEQNQALEIPSNILLRMEEENQGLQKFN